MQWVAFVSAIGLGGGAAKRFGVASVSVFCVLRQTYVCMVNGNRDGLLRHYGRIYWCMWAGIILRGTMVDGTKFLLGKIGKYIPGFLS